jgi:hypothetical protein
MSGVSVNSEPARRLQVTMTGHPILATSANRRDNHDFFKEIQHLSSEDNKESLDRWTTFVQCAATYSRARDAFVHREGQDAQIKLDGLQLVCVIH